MAALSTSLLVGSMVLTGASAYSQYQGQRKAARGAEAQGRAAQELAGFEAGLLEEQAEDSLARGREQELRHRGDVSRLKGSQRARLAAQGIDIDTGSAGLLQEETAILGEVDAITIRNNARREAYGYRAQAELVRKGGSNMAAGYRNEAASIRNQSYGTLLTGGAQLAGMYGSTRRTVPRSTGPTSSSSPSGSVGMTPTYTPRPTVTVRGAKPWWQG